MAIYKRDFHESAEFSGLYNRYGFFCLLDDVFIKCFCHFRFSGMKEAGTISFLTVGIKGELRNEKQTSADIP